MNMEKFRERNSFLKVVVLGFLFIVSLMLFFGCNDSHIYSITMSIEEGVFENNTYILPYPEGNSKPIKITFKINPSEYTPKNLTFSSSDSAAAIINSDGYLVLRTWQGEGDRNVVLTASYKNSDGSVTSSYLRIKITKTPQPKFSSSSFTTFYAGRDLKGDYKVQNESEEYEYKYYDLSSGLETEEIVNAGEYLINYVKNNSSTVYASASLTILPYEINLKGEDGESSFGKPIDEKFLKEDFTQASEYFSNVGQDAGQMILKYYNTTTAKEGFNTGEYKTDVVYKIEDQYKNNYVVKTQSGVYKITPRRVAIVLDNQRITYGDNLVRNKYKIYDYDEFIENNNSTTGLSSLDNSLTNYASNISTGEYSYLKEGEDLEKNTYGYYDAGSYEITYKNLTTTKNLESKIVVDGVVTISKKDVSVTPNANLVKTYGEEDNFDELSYTALGIVNSREIKSFLKIDYSTVSNDIVLGEKNYNAPVGAYYYEIDNNINPNYNFTLTEKAQKTYQNAEDRIVFRVDKSIILFEFEEYSANYLKPKGQDFYASYFGGDCDFKLTIKSLKVNGEEKVEDGELTIKGEEFDELGKILLPCGEIFSVGIKLEQVLTQSDRYFQSFRVNVQSANFYEGDENNYSIQNVYSFVNLSKLKVKVVPTMDEALNRKVFDGTTDDMKSIENYLNAVKLESSEELLLQDVIYESSYLLTFKNENGKCVCLGNGGLFTRDFFKDAGVYKVFLNKSVSVKDGKEYIEFELDDNYTFEILPYEVKINIEEEQTKLYGEEDREISFVVDGATPIIENNLEFSGSLKRQAGEKVGSYDINLGDLKLTDNYKLVLQTNGYKYVITQRVLNITPISYTITYGSSDPVRLEYYTEIVGEYSSSLLGRIPQFIGELSLSKNGEIVQKTNGFYPVFVESGEVKDYDIVRGTLDIEDENFFINFVEGSKFRVEKKQITINIVPETLENDDNIGEIVEEITSTHISCSGLVGQDSIKITNVTITKNADNTTYSVLGLENMTIDIVNGSGNRDCYDISLGQNVVYVVASELINFKLVSIENGEMMVEKTYSGENYENTFKLVVDSDRYDIVDKETNIKIVFSSFEEEDVRPINVGSYMVNVVFEENTGKITLKNKNTEETYVITSFNKVESGKIASLTQRGYLTINRADIKFLESDLAFENSIEYGTKKEELPELKLITDEGKPIFTDVSGNTLNLMTYGEYSRHYEFKSSSFEIESLNASATPYFVNLSIAVKGSDGRESNNYNKTTLQVPLMVKNKVLDVEVGTFVVPYDDEDNKTMTYNGAYKYLSLDLDAGEYKNSYKTVYKYTLLDAVYNDNTGDKAVAQVTRVSSAGEAEEIALTIDDILDIKGEVFTNISYNGKTCVQIANSEYTYYLYTRGDNAVCRDAGIYICEATSSALQNYEFSLNGKNTKDLSFTTFFEIRKSSNVLVDWKKIEFKYGTIFNVIYDQKSLPFDYTMTPDLKGQVEYVEANVGDFYDWESVGFKLNVQKYSIILRVANNPNYFYSQKFEFDVVPCDAKIEFPEQTSYTYIGENMPVTAFLDNISVVRLDKDGMMLDRIFYTDVKDEGLFNFKYFTEGTEELEEAPYQVGNYILRVTYGNEGSSSYYGTGDFRYSIAKRSFAGVVGVSNKTLTYNPAYTAEYLLSEMEEMLRASADMGEFTFDIKDGTTGDILTKENGDEWLSRVNKFNRDNPFVVTFVIHFNDGITSDREVSGNLTINKRPITNANLFMETKNTTINYSGFAIMGELSFRDVGGQEERVNLSAIGEAGSEVNTPQITADNGLVYSYTIKYEDNFVVGLYDKLGGLMFRLKYSYFIVNYLNEETPINYRPISPNPYSTLDQMTNEQYRVKYQIIEAGDNYSITGFNLKEKTYRISKLNTLYISLSNIVTEYNGENVVENFSENNIFVSNVQGEETNMKVTVFIEKTTQTGQISYSESDGVKLVVRYLKNEGDTQIPVDEIVNAGNYSIAVSFLKHNSYDLGKYFNQVYFGSNRYYSYDFTEAIDYCTYNIYLDAKVEVKQHECEFDTYDENLENIGDLLDFRGSYYEVKEEGTNQKILYIDLDSTFTLKSTERYEIKLYRYVNDYEYLGRMLGDLPQKEGARSPTEEERNRASYDSFFMIIESKDPNYMSSRYITLKRLYVEIE